MTEQLSWTARARNTDPETSHAAAASVTRIRESQWQVLGTLRDIGPATDEEILVWLDQSDVDLWRTWTPSGARTRRSELVRMGLVEDSGQRRRLRTGRLGIVWRVKEAA